MSVLALVVRLAPLIEKELNLVIKSKEEAETLSSKLKKIEAGLHDAETRGVTEPSVKAWLKNLEGVAAEMHDVLDELEILNLQAEAEGVSPEASHFVDDVRRLALSLCSCFKQVTGRREVTKKMIDLSENIDKILSEKGKYEFVQGRNESFRHDETIADAPESGAIGRDADIASLVEKLISWGGEEEDHIHTHVISIVGIVGLGKTTLAQCIYNVVAIDGVFLLKGWVSVSEPFDASEVARGILEAFGDTTSAADSSLKLNTLCQRLKEVVKKKRFFLVLDNVWSTIKTQQWESLKNCLRGAKGSRILVTTTEASAVNTVGTTQFKLNPLTDEDCSRILNGIALKGRRMEEEYLKKLSDIGAEIAKKCNGLPLAARFLGSILALKQSEEEWRAVLRSPLWSHENKVNDVFHILNFSYTDLSPTLKRCFLSIVVRSKGTSISVKKMIKIWMAYGYLNPSDSFAQVQSKGLEYFKNLEMRSFFQECNSGGKVSYKLHNIMHEFATHLESEKECSFVGDKESVPENWNSLGKLRTFCARNINESQLHLNALCDQLRSSVRLLSLRDCNLESLPEGVGELLHLRYADFSGNPIRELPNTVSNLYYLQTLRIRNCKLLSSLPEGIEKLTNLRYIINSGTDHLVDYPRGFGQLTGLWTLKEFKGATLGRLGGLNQIQGSLKLDVSGLSDSVEQFREANLGSKTNINKLILNLGKRDTITGIVEALEPPPNLKTLDIESSGQWLSHWIPTSSFNNLKTVKFRGRAKHSHVMPPFGRLPALEDLLIHGCSFKHLRNIDFLGMGKDVPEQQLSSYFPRLKKLRFTKCHNWEEWENIEEAADGPVIMRCLKELEIRKCEKMKDDALPSFILRRHTELKIVII